MSLADRMAPAENGLGGEEPRLHLHSPEFVACAGIAALLPLQTHLVVNTQRLHRRVGCRFLPWQHILWEQ
jgi:hypothetical protein